MATTFKVCRDLAHAVELYEAGLLTVDLDIDLWRKSPEYVTAMEEFGTVEELKHLYVYGSGWRTTDFGYLEED